MPQNHLYTNPIPNSAMASHGVSWRHTVTAGSDSDQRSTRHDVRYKFTGKERDAETGFDYTSTVLSAGFGARYYASDLSVWLGVDPLADKYPSTSPYAYVFNNPVMFIDKWGLEGENPPTKQRNNWFKNIFRRKKEEPIAMHCSLEPVDIIAKKSSTSESKKASFLGNIGKSISKFFRGLGGLFQGNNHYNQADGIVLMNKTLSAGNNENAHLKPKKGQKEWDGRVVFADYLQVALGLGENTNPSLNVAVGIGSLNDFFEAVNEVNNERKNKSIPQSMRFPEKFTIGRKGSGYSTIDYSYSSEKDSIEKLEYLKEMRPYLFDSNTIINPYYGL